MDILSARRKAAERAGRKAQSQEKTGDIVSESTDVRVSAPEQGAPPAGGPAAEAGEVPASGAAEESVEVPASTEASEAAVQELELLAFRLGGEEYAVTVDEVREVLKMREITPVPHAPPYVLGVTSLRGAVLPVVDLCARLGIRPGARDEKSRIVVVGVHDEDAGILVDRVTGVVRLPSDSVRPAPETVAQGAGAEFLRGIARKDDRLYILLDMEKAAGG